MSVCLCSCVCGHACAMTNVWQSGSPGWPRHPSCLRQSLMCKLLCPPGCLTHKLPESASHLTVWAPGLETWTTASSYAWIWVSKLRSPHSHSKRSSSWAISSALLISNSQSTLIIQFFFLNTQQRAIITASFKRTMFWGHLSKLIILKWRRLQGQVHGWLDP